jgi:hypothetical protein
MRPIAFRSQGYRKDLGRDAKDVMQVQIGTITLFRSWLTTVEMPTEREKQSWCECFSKLPDFLFEQIVASK